MNDMVTARVPSEIKRQGNSVLKQIGATATQLVNAAYEYVIAEGRLPSPRKAIDAETIPDNAVLQTRTLPPSATAELSASLAASTFEVPASFWGGRPYKDLIAEGRWADYEALA